MPQWMVALVLALIGFLTVCASLVLFAIDLRAGRARAPLRSRGSVVLVVGLLLLAVAISVNGA